MPGKAAAYVAVEVPMRVHEIGHGLVGPLADLRDVFSGCRGQKTRIDDQYGLLADDDVFCC
jgi:hypothetical protein